MLSYKATINLTFLVFDCLLFSVSFFIVAALTSHYWGLNTAVVGVPFYTVECEVKVGVGEITDLDRVYI